MKIFGVSMHLANFTATAKAAAFGVVVCCCLLGGGCLHFEQSLLFHRDGSVIATYQYSVPTSLLPSLRAAQAALEQQTGQAKKPSSDMNWFLSEKAVRDFFAQPGVEVRQYRQQERDGRHLTQIVILARDGIRAVNTGLFGAMKVQQQEDGKTVLLVEPPGENQPWSAAQKERWRQLAADLQINFTVTTASPVLSSNGTQVSPNKVSWKFTGDDTESSLFSPIPALTVTW